MSVGVDDLYYGTEKWDVQNSASQFISNFETLSTRTATLANAVYKTSPKISVFVSEQTILELTGGTRGTLRNSVKGIVLLFGYDGSSLVLIARSANGRAARPADTSFINVNYKAPNVQITDSATDTLSTTFATSTGYAALAGLPNGTGTHPVFNFDCDILLQLLYTDASAVGGQVSMHLVAAPPWSDDLTAGNFIGIMAQKGNIYRGDAPCPPYCYQNA